METIDWLFPDFGSLLSFFAFSVVVGILHLFLAYAGLYETVWWIDIPMHFFGGVSLGIGFSLLLKWFQQKSVLGKMHPFLFFAFVMGLSSFFVIAWEFFEFVASPVFYLSRLDALMDTLQDLFLGLLGSALAFFALRLLKKA